MIALGVAQGLRSALHDLAAGRALVVDYFASARCGVAVGDITVDFGPQPAPETHARIEDIDGVRVYAERRLLWLLTEAGPCLERRHMPFSSHVGLRLDHPEQWLAFLERPGVTAGKLPLDRWRHRSA